MTTSLRTLVREMPFPLPRCVQRWCDGDLRWTVDPELMRRMEAEIVAATSARRLQEQGIDV
ncbi:UNVERIFIED_CONTAM: hypothetical protein RF653_10270 [Kocuria sp. CPCC 205316]|uniref:hypothetical protein n=1 Tax=Kocuria TaxID=57493 RepID=UPI0036DCCBC2